MTTCTKEGCGCKKAFEKLKVDVAIYPNDQIWLFSAGWHSRDEEIITLLQLRDSVGLVALQYIIRTPKKKIKQNMKREVK